MQINVHSIIPASRVNGPGLRTVVFFQGCEKNCPGCFNPRTHSTEPHMLLTPEKILAEVPTGVTGLTISGGEAFLQPLGLAALLQAAKKNLGLSTVVYTGYRMEELSSVAGAQNALKLIDALIDGPYDRTRKETSLLARGSSNQRIILLTPVFSEEDFMMPGRAEIIIREDGSVVETGFSRPVVAI